MGIRADGEALLRALASGQGGTDDAGRGHTSISAKDFHHAGFPVWAIPRFNDAVEWLLKKKYIEDDETIGSAPFAMKSLTVTIEGRLAAESIEPTVAMDSVYALNRNARTLLVRLHAAHLGAKGSSWGLSFDEEEASRLGFDYSAFRLAAQRLVDRGLAKRVAHDSLTSTPRGVDTVEYPTRLARELHLPDQSDAEDHMTPRTPDNKKVFIIHGRHEPARNEMGIFLRSMGLEPLWFRDVRKTMGGTAHIVKVVERGMEQAQGVLALFVPEEFSGLHPRLRKTGEAEENIRCWQARPNILFEAGLAFGRNPDRVAFVLFGEVKLFTDASGIHVYRPTNEHDPESYRAQLRGLLAGGMGCAVNMHSDDWMTAGDFDAVTNGLLGVSPRDPFPDGAVAPGTASVQVSLAYEDDSEGRGHFIATVTNVGTKVLDNWTVELLAPKPLVIGGSNNAFGGYRAKYSDDKTSSFNNTPAHAKEHSIRPGGKYELKVPYQVTEQSVDLLYEKVVARAYVADKIESQIERSVRELTSFFAAARVALREASKQRLHNIQSGRG